MDITLEQFISMVPLSARRIFGYGLLGFLLVVPLVVPLNSLPLVVCDETRIGLNSVEMLLNRNFLVTTALGQPDHWNTKPVLLHWLQAGSMHLFGIHLFALRLPSLVAALGTCVALIHAGKRLFGRRWIGWLAAFVLVGSSGFNQVHVAWTGDYEATLTLFCLTYVLAFYNWLSSRETRWGWVFWISLTAATLTKGVAGLLFTPALGVFLLANPASASLLWVFRERALYLGAILFLLSVGGYYGIREVHDPGYIRAVVQNELGGRFNQPRESLPLPWYYYLLLLAAGWFKYLLPVIAWGGVAGWLDPKHRHPMSYLMLVGSVFLAIITMSRTKWYWYAGPVLPVIALIAGYGTFRLGMLVRNFRPQSRIAHAGLWWCVAVFIAFPYGQTLLRMREIVHHYAYHEPEGFSAFLHQAYRQRVSLKDWALVVPLGANLSQLAFYQAMFRQKGNPFQLAFVDRMPECPAHLIVGNAEQPWIEKTYAYSVVDSGVGVKRYRVYSRKDALRGAAGR